MLDLVRARAAIVGIAQRVAADSDHLRELDAQLGDGDLGVTVTLGCEAVMDRMRSDHSPTFDLLFGSVGEAFAGGNPSTMANLTGAALRRMAREAGTVETIEDDRWVPLLDAAIAAIQRRGRAERGDKTILDGLLGSRDAMNEHPRRDGPSTALATTARQGAEAAAAAIVERESRVGRAAWQRERSRGVPDPGAAFWVSITRAIEAECRSESLRGETAPDRA